MAPFVFCFAKSTSLPEGGTFAPPRGGAVRVHNLFDKSEFENRSNNAGLIAIAQASVPIYAKRYGNKNKNVYKIKGK